MKKLYLIFFTLILSSCYTEFEKRSRTLEEIIEISDSTVFFPTKDFCSSDYKIKNLYGKWINSREEKNSVIDIYRPDNYMEFKPTRFRGEINFYENGNCEFLKLEPTDGYRYLKYRWRLLKVNPNIICLYNENGDKEKNLRIEKLEFDILKIVWVY